LFKLVHKSSHLLINPAKGGIPPMESNKMAQVIPIVLLFLITPDNSITKKFFMGLIKITEKM
jgi:hypothetical protein